MLVPKGGFEPPRACAHMTLNHARLPSSATSARAGQQRRSYIGRRSGEKSRPEMADRPIITLLTDFGTADAFVGVMKGVILGMAPQVHLVDLTHEVPPQAVAVAAFLLEAAWREFPPWPIHPGVMGPGVRSRRRS